MIHAYDKSYLSNAQKNLACMLDYLVNELDNSIEDAWKWFLSSKSAILFEQGDCSVIAGKSGIELAYAVLEDAGKERPDMIKMLPYNRSREYWTGWAIAYYQWETGLPFAEIEEAIPIQEIYMLYEPYHEMDIRQFVDKMNELYHDSSPDTNLKALRTLSGFTQAELAEQTNIPLRTIQQYEQRQKNINKAQAETLLRLSRVLNCSVEDLMEKVPVSDPI